MRAIILIMIGDNVVLRPPRLSSLISQNTKRLITFAVRVARLMRWVSKTESPHTPLIRGSDPAETVELRSTPSRPGEVSEDGIYDIADAQQEHGGARIGGVM